MSVGSPDFYQKTSTVIKQSEVSVPVSIEDSKVTVDVNVQGGQIQAEITNTPIDVNVQGGNINANITNSEINTVITDSQITLDVETAQIYGARMLLANYDEPADGFVGLMEKTWKIYPLLARGYLKKVCVRFRNTSDTDDTVTMRLRPWWNGPVLYTWSWSIPKGADGWYCAPTEMNWESETLIIELEASYGTAEVAYSNGGPYDTFSTDLSGYLGIANWRLHAYAEVWFKSRPNVVVSGYVTPVPMPKKQYYFSSSWQSLNPQQEVVVLTINGRGRLKYVSAVMAGDAYNYIVLRVYADGNIVTGYYDDRPTTINYYAGVNLPTQPRLVKYDTANYRCAVVFDEEVEFYRELKLALMNYHSSASGSARIWVTHYVLE